MKSRKLLSFILAAIYVMMLAVPSSALEDRASDQIAVYDMAVTPIPGSLAVYVTVTGCGTMKKLGCESIYVYRNVDTRWILSEIKKEDDTNMSSSNTFTHTNTIYCYGSYGSHYQVVVTIFAEDKYGRDTRTETFYVTGTNTSPTTT